MALEEGIPYFLNGPSPSLDAESQQGTILVMLDEGTGEGAVMATSGAGVPARRKKAHLAYLIDGYPAMILNRPESAPATLEVRPAIRAPGCERCAPGGV